MTHLTIQCHLLVAIKFLLQFIIWVNVSYGILYPMQQNSKTLVKAFITFGHYKSTFILYLLKKFVSYKQGNI